VLLHRNLYQVYIAKIKKIIIKSNFNKIFFVDAPRNFKKKQEDNNQGVIKSKVNTLATWQLFIK